MAAVDLCTWLNEHKSAAAMNYFLNIQLH